MNLFYREVFFFCVYRNLPSHFGEKFRWILQHSNPSKLQLLTVWRGLFWLYNTLITPLCYLWRLFPCTHLQNCLSEGFFFTFFIWGNFTQQQQQQSSYWFIELCLIQITIQSDCNCSVLCDANEGVREYAFPPGDFYARDLNHSRWNS